MKREEEAERKLKAAQVLEDQKLQETTVLFPEIQTKDPIATV